VSVKMTLRRLRFELTAVSVQEKGASLVGVIGKETASW
jgi:hypothetical protein